MSTNYFKHVYMKRHFIPAYFYLFFRSSDKTHWFLSFIQLFLKNKKTSEIWLWQKQWSLHTTEWLMNGLSFSTVRYYDGCSGVRVRESFRGPYSPWSTDQGSCAHGLLWFISQVVACRIQLSIRMVFNFVLNTPWNYSCYEIVPDVI